MIPRKLMRVVFLLASSASLVLGFGLGGLPVGVVLAALAGASCTIAIRTEARWVTTTFLSVMVCLAAAGVLSGCPAFPMVLAASLALGAWDLSGFDHCLDESDRPRAQAPVDARHALFLAGALGVGLALAAAGMALSFRVPFPLMLLAAVFGFVGLDGAARAGR